MLRFSYPASLAKSDDEYVVRFRDLPELVISGATQDEALVMALDALAKALGRHVSASEPLPIATPPHVGEVLLTLPPALAAPLIIESELIRQGISRHDLGRRLGRSERHVARLLAGRAPLEHSISAIETLGMQVQITVVPTDPHPSPQT